MILYQDGKGTIDLIPRGRDQSSCKLDLKHENGPGYQLLVMNEFLEEWGGYVIGEVTDDLDLFSRSSVQPLEIKFQDVCVDEAHIPYPMAVKPTAK